MRNIRRFGAWLLGGAIATVMSNAGLAQAATFTANIDGGQVVPGTGSTATGLASFTLNEDETELAYTLSFEGVNLTATDRTAPADVNKIHIHVAPRGENGPHTLNIFGLPAEDDADLVVDYAANTLSGVWDDGDVSDLNGDGVADPNDSKPLTSFVDALKGGELYLQVHTNRFDAATGFPGEIRGQIIADATGDAAETPEPLSALGLMAAAGAASVVLRRRSLG